VAWEYDIPTLASVFDMPVVPSDPVGPWFPALVPAPSRYVADLLDIRVKASNAATLKKFRDMESAHSTAWFRLSSNKEADERGSRASVSVTGLRRPSEPSASLSLDKMLPIAQDFFNKLHTPEPPCECRRELQESMLVEVSRVYGHLPRPKDIDTGAFSLKEVLGLVPRMHNTTPGRPDGIHNGFWKSLQKRLADADPPIPDLWEVFRDLTDDIRANGSSRCKFKDTNLSLFFKKGDPTLVSNYRPISSMNTDCKMYTNLVNSRLSPWAVSLLHKDQKGFILGRLIMEHTCLAAEVMHLSNSTATDTWSP